MDIKRHQTWEMYSSYEVRWLPVRVTDIDHGRVTLRYEGTTEFTKVELLDMQNKPELFRPAKFP